MSDLSATLRKTTEQMASTCSVPMDLWCEHSDVALKAADEMERLRALALDFQKAYLNARQEAFEEAAKISETWRCSLRPGNPQRLLGHQDAAAQIAAAIRIASKIRSVDK